jgi:regulator of protease activity HflC (stomatin/prohibitin superfamily)
MSAGIVVLIVLLVLAIVLLAKSLTVIRQAQRGIVERLGKYKETLEPGLRFLIPFIDSLVSRIDMRETVIDIPPQPVITNDNVTVTIDAVIYYYVTDAKAVRYEVANFYTAVSKLAQTNIRNVVGEMTLEESLSSRERINTALTNTLDQATDKWGVKVTRVEVKEIEPPRDISDAMSKQMKAEREKRATILEAQAYREKQILEAEGDKQNAILTAEGVRQKSILIAEGERQAAILRAEGEAQAIENVSKAADKYFIGNAQLLKQLQVTQASLEKNSKLIVSDQSKLINVLGLGDAMIEAQAQAKPDKQVKPEKKTG